MDIFPPQTMRFFTIFNTKIRLERSRKADFFYLVFFLAFSSSITLFISNRFAVLRDFDF